MAASGSSPISTSRSRSSRWWPSSPCAISATRTRWASVGASAASDTSRSNARYSPAPSSPSSSTTPRRYAGSSSDGRPTEAPPGAPPAAPTEAPSGDAADATPSPDARVPAEPTTEGDRLLAAAPPPERPRRLPPDIHDRIRDGLHDVGVTHVYVNWPEINRLNSTYAYRLDGRLRQGFSEHITPRLLADLLSRGHLRPLATFGGGVVPPFAIYELR